jgi:glutamate carboxypeptidase
MKGLMAICANATFHSLVAAACALPVVLAAATQRPALSDAEQQIAAFIDASNAGALALLERVVNINSGTMNLTGVRDVGAIFRGELERLGFATEWVDQSAVQRAGHLIARHRGSGPKILLIGHLDTVFERDHPFQKFERLDATTARGPGVIDMKGGDVVMLQALKALDAAGLLKTMNIVVALMGDEEEPGRPRAVARAPLVEAAKGAAAAIGFEDGDGDPQHAITARRGTTSWELRVSARSGHSSQIFSEELGAGAVFEAARILDAFRTRLASEPHLTFNPGLIVGGTAAEVDAAGAHGSSAGKNNVIASDVRVVGDLRALTVDQFARARDVMTEIVRGSLPGARATIAFDEGYPPLAPTEGNASLLAIYDQASRDLGFPAVTAVSPDRAGAADVSFVASEVPRVLDGVGMKGHDDHSASETADLTTLPVQAKRAAVLLHRLSRTLR